MQNINLSPYLSQIKIPTKGSSKGDNGRVLVIGGSRLFHAAAFWSASMASHLVDMVHFTSPMMENNDLMRRRAKAKFWDGIVVPYEEVEHYIKEDDAILIGPGMERGAVTREIVNTLLKKYPHKKWIIDGGALQEVDPGLLNSNMIITPNHKELKIIKNKLGTMYSTLNTTILAKGSTDKISSCLITDHCLPITISGGSPGLTRGGTGDVLAGLVLGLAARSDSYASCIVASYTLKQASEKISQTHGTFFTPNHLIGTIPTILAPLLDNQGVQNPSLAPHSSV